MLKLNAPGLYNIYNAIAALTVAGSLKVDYQVAINALENSHAAFGRTEVLPFQNKMAYMLLIKNPTGFNQMIQTFLKPKPQSTSVLFAINDKIADGTDVSWLWDAALEDIRGYQGMIVCSGSRAHDMALRLKYAGIKNMHVEPDLHMALNYVSTHSNSKNLYILPTYTAMLDIYSQITQTKDVDSYSQITERGSI